MPETHAHYVQPSLFPDLPTRGGEQSPVLHFDEWPPSSWRRAKTIRWAWLT